MATVELNKENFQSLVDGSKMAIIDFWAPWCGPCKMFGPLFEEVSESNPDYLFGKVNTETEQELGAHFAIRSIPTLMIIREGVVLFSQAGALPRHALEEVLEKAMAIDMKEVHADIARESKQN